MRKPEVVDMTTEWGKHLKASNKNGNKNGSPKRLYHHSRRMKTKEHDRKELNDEQ